MTKISIHTVLTESNVLQTIIEGDLAIRDSAEIKEELLMLLRDNQTTEIQFKNIERLDVAALQLLAALLKSAANQKKAVTYNFEQTEYTNNILNNSGFSQLFEQTPV